MNDQMFSIVDEILSQALTENFEKILQGGMSVDKIISDTEFEQVIDHRSPAVESYPGGREPLPQDHAIYRRVRISTEDTWGPWVFVSRYN